MDLLFHIISDRVRFDMLIEFRDIRFEYIFSSLDEFIKNTQYIRGYGHEK